MKKDTYIVSPETKAERLDTYVSSKSGLSRSHVQKLIKQGLVIVNSRIEKVSYKVKNGDSIELTIPDKPESTPSPDKLAGLGMTLISSTLNPCVISKVNPAPICI